MGKFLVVLFVILYPQFTEIVSAKEASSFVIKLDSHYFAPVADGLRWTLVTPENQKNNFYLNVWLIKNDKLINKYTNSIDVNKNKFINLFFYHINSAKGLYIPDNEINNLIATMKVSIQIINIYNANFSGFDCGIFSAHQNINMITKKTFNFKLNKKIMIMSLNNSITNKRLSTNEYRKSIMGYDKEPKNKLSMKLYICCSNNPLEYLAMERTTKSCINK